MSNRANGEMTPLSDRPRRSFTELLRSDIPGSLLLLIPAALLLLPTLAFPLGPDHGMFFVSAQKILAGAAHYRDIVDVKPPLIYHIYAIGIALFGPTEWSVRIVDLLIQIATCWLLVRICRRHSDSLLTPLVATISYALLYTGLGAYATAQTESYVGILGLAAWMMISGRRTTSRFIFAGMACGALFLLKFTLGAMLGIVLIAELLLFGERAIERVRNAALIFSGFIFMAALLPLYLLVFDAWEGYAMLQRFMQGYVMLQFGSVGSTGALMYREVTVILPGNYSLVMLLATAAGIVSTLHGPGVDDPRRRDLWRLLSFCTIAIAVFALTLVVEGKYYGYQFTRIYPFGVLLAGFGIEALLSRRALDNLHTSYFILHPFPFWRTAMLIVPLSVIALLLSPLPHFLWQSMPFALQITKGTPAVDAFYSRDTTQYARLPLKRVGGYVHDNLKPDEKLVVLASTAGLVYYHAGYLPDLPIYHSAFLLATFAPDEWRNLVGRHIVEKRPRFIVIEHGDLHELQTASKRTSPDLLRILPGVDTLVRQQYRSEFRAGSYEVLGRQENTGDRSQETD